MLSNQFQYRLENLGLWFQGGVRRGILFFFVACIIASVPVYFLLGLLSGSWFKTAFNPWSFEQESFTNNKFIPEQKLETSVTQILDLKDGSRQLYAAVSNKLNPLIGYFPFVYDLQILDNNNQLIAQKTERSYLLPGEVKYVIWEDPDARGTKLAVIRRPETQIVYYNPNSPTVKKPDLRVVDQGFRIRTETPILYVNFRMKNDSRLQVKDVNIIYILRDSRESVVGIGEFLFTNFMPLEERSIEIDYLQPKTRTPVLVEIIWSVNYLDTGNLI